jgi:hypothetical protein
MSSNGVTAIRSRQRTHFLTSLVYVFDILTKKTGITIVRMLKRDFRYTMLQR